MDGGVVDGGEVDGGVLDGGEVDGRVVAGSSGEALALAVCVSRLERVGCGSPGSLYHVAPALCAGGSPWLTPLSSSVPAAGATLFLEERRLGRWRRTARAARRTLR